MAQSFNCAQNKALVLWKETIIYNMIRMTIGGVVLFFLSFLVVSGMNRPPWELLGASIYWLVWGLPLLLIYQKLPEMLQIGVGFGILCFLLIGLVADPFIFVASKVNPALVLMEKPRFMAFSAVVFILKS